MRNEPQIFIVDQVIRPAKRAMTIPPFGIFVKCGHENDQSLLAHEKAHWEQYKKLGLFTFIGRYIVELMRFGYDNMPLENEANYYEKEVSKKW